MFGRYSLDVVGVAMFCLIAAFQNEYLLSLLSGLWIVVSQTINTVELLNSNKLQSGLWIVISQTISIVELLNNNKLHGFTGVFFGNICNLFPKIG